MLDVSEIVKNSPSDASAILGKTIRAVIIKDAVEPHWPPNSQLFLIFDDGTSYEFFCHADVIRQTKGLWNGDITSVQRYMEGAMKIVFEARLKSA